jgi:hypothetical protein
MYVLTYGQYTAAKNRSNQASSDAGSRRNDAARDNDAWGEMG